jgi:hypothetical protein
MKKYFLLLIPVLLFSFTFSWTQSFDCRTFNFGATPEMILKGESAVLLKEEVLAHNLKGISFVENKDEANYILTYTFHLNKLNGLKIKKMSLTGDNNMMTAMEDYKVAFARYNANCGTTPLVEKRDKVSGLKFFEIEQTNKRIFVNIIKESEEYFLTENIIKK